MIDLSWELLPALLGIVASPLAVMALIAVLLSKNARVNGVLYLAGWTCAVIIAVGGGYWLFGWLDVAPEHDPPPWIPPLRLVAGLLVGTGAVFTYRRSRAKLAAMAGATTPEEVAAAAPQLPGWLQAVASFTGPRSFALGLGIFLLNPVNLSCALIAALDIRLAALSAGTSTGFMIAFMALSIVPMSVPVLLTLAKGEKAGPVLETLRAWIAKNNGTLSTVFLSLLAFGQIQKSLAAIPWL
ncbi:GAP family protein [Arthrobacter sp. HY1533]|uniref:GAP family protein n=1 Tax=Arthrobacter sp. HY1533 TaxID=2970919 RepID=UPI0022BA05E3|nr:GAP family protein [Arthrobacter sp. HY1533]